jgi:hypothetical protein
VLLPLKKE